MKQEVNKLGGEIIDLTKVNKVLSDFLKDLERI